MAGGSTAMEGLMHAAVRTYSGQGASALFDVIEERKAEVQAMMEAITGFVSYAVVRTGNGGVTITVCDDKAGTDESVRVARDWVGTNAAAAGAAAPQVAEGPVILHLG
jgi:hypothetical protein